MDKTPARQTRTQWRCTSRDCGFSAVLTQKEEASETPVCKCGALLRKEELPPAFSYLDFLRSEVDLVNATGREEES